MCEEKEKYSSSCTVLSCTVLLWWHVYTAVVAMYCVWYILWPYKNTRKQLAQCLSLLGKQDNFKESLFKVSC